jgi:hypothetical protein
MKMVISGSQKYLIKSKEKQLHPSFPYKPSLNLKSVKIDEVKTPRAGISVEQRLIGYKDIYSKQKEDLQHQHLLNESKNLIFEPNIDPSSPRKVNQEKWTQLHT